MKRSPIGPRKARLERKRLLRTRRPWRAGVSGDHELRAAFFAFADDTCALEQLGGCDGPLDPHHVLPKRAIKTYAKERRLDARATALLLWDTSNRLVLCRRHHDRHETAKERVPREIVPNAAVAFAQTLGLAALIDRLYPYPTLGDRRC